ncbi:hypothetical protein [Microbispora sp. NBC_01389]|uniref:hypothetical protein n=1 Tax=Microbispora sp. NBC_01389 TaxID=2903584 RepID=UPI00324C59E0
MIRGERSHGRHREGAVPGGWRPRAWDLGQRVTARRLAGSWPGWTVLYGAGSRRFYALATGPVPTPLILEASTAAELEIQLRQETPTLAAWHPQARAVATTSHALAATPPSPTGKAACPRS